MKTELIVQDGDETVIHLNSLVEPVEKGKQSELINEK